LPERPKDLEEAKVDASEDTQKLEKVEAGTAEFLVDLEEKRSIKVGANSFYFQRYTLLRTSLKVQILPDTC